MTSSGSTLAAAGRFLSKTALRDFPAKTRFLEGFDIESRIRTETVYLIHLIYWIYGSENQVIMITQDTPIMDPMEILSNDFICASSPTFLG